MKQCCRCKETKSTLEFRKRSKTLDGFEYYCKACSKLADDKNAERQRAADRKHYYANREKRLAKNKRWICAKQGKELPEYWVERLPKPKMSRSPEEAREYEKARLREYKINNKEALKEKYSLYCQTEQGKENNRLKSRRYRTLKAGLESSLSKKEIDLIILIQNGECACCGNEFNSDFGYEIDHVIPVSLGGNLCFDNVQLLCRSCNARKKDQVIMYRPKVNPECLSFI